MIMRSMNDLMRISACLPFLFFARAQEKKEKETTIIRQSHEETIDGWIPAGCLFFLLKERRAGIGLSPHDGSCLSSSYTRPDGEKL